MNPASPRILTINGGSSSIKFALFEAGEAGASLCRMRAKRRMCGQPRRSPCSVTR
jgi:acetate kinase